jgi:hypothetical protein
VKYPITIFDGIGEIKVGSAGATSFVAFGQADRRPCEFALRFLEEPVCAPVYGTEKCFALV